MSEEKKDEKAAKAASAPQQAGEAQKEPPTPPTAAPPRAGAPPPPIPPGSYRPVAPPAGPAGAMTQAPRPPTPPPSGTAPVPPRPPQAAPLPPRPPSAPAPPTRPVGPPAGPRPATPPAAAPKPQSRRGFIQFLSVLGSLLILAPFVPWGEFLTASIKNPGKYQRQKVVIDNKPEYKAAAGKVVNVNDLQTFPPNSHWVITYPTSGDSTLDAADSDTFTKYELIRIPAELGGEMKDASAFVAFSKVCVHLWCSPNYNPAEGHKQYECPCHGSAYRLPDGLATAGPAEIQPPPANAMPILIFTADKDGTLNIEPPVWDVNRNGVLGLGRALYQDGKVNVYKEAA